MEWKLTFVNEVERRFVNDVAVIAVYRTTGARHCIWLQHMASSILPNCWYQ